uniref:NADH-ubiquinone oxidoreductase chain 6 n=1 Tax=Coleoptera sp. 10 KM-2017 TaxID=2219313 RepID=A0A346RGH1_9COLE|nr:NADH dehydrogenase subunit 6 [Coleoptera sp. 10 KM-2017]
MSVLLMLNMLLSSTIIFMKHPLSLGAALLMQTINVALISGTLNMNFWFSYILTLIMIGGMLILFIYMTSIASNEKFKFSSPIAIMYMIMMNLVTMLMMTDQFMWNENLNNSDMSELTSMMNFTLMLNKFTNYPNNLMMYLTVIYLFITLIAVVKITKMQEGPLRHKN